MSYRIFVPALLCLALSIAVYIVSARPTSHSPHTQEVSSQSTTRASDDRESGNLSVQPEAVKLSRRVRGGRFDATKPRSVVMYGVLTTANDKRNVQITRYQTGAGEHVEVSVADAKATLSWDSASGAHSSAATLDLNDRRLLERLTLDSADQFIFAQLRGASYYTVAHNVRPDGAPDNTSGPIWDVVRIDEPAQDDGKQPLSRWRLFYLNTATGLIDKIAYDSQGDRTEVNLADWTDQHGEKFPSTISWTSQGQTLLTFNLTTVSFVAQ
jgi:hypothetical protein